MHKMDNLYLKFQAYILGYIIVHDFPPELERESLMYDNYIWRRIKKHM